MPLQGDPEGKQTSVGETAKALQCWLAASALLDNHISRNERFSRIPPQLNKLTSVRTFQVIKGKKMTFWHLHENPLFQVWPGLGSHSCPILPVYWVEKSYSETEHMIPHQKQQPSFPALPCRLKSNAFSVTLAPGIEEPGISPLEIGTFACAMFKCGKCCIRITADFSRFSTQSGLALYDEPLMSRSELISWEPGHSGTPQWGYLKPSTNTEPEPPPWYTSLSHEMAERQCHKLVGPLWITNCGWGWKIRMCRHPWYSLTSGSLSATLISVPLGIGWDLLKSRIVWMCLAGET